jgi:hypothetical protein
MSETTISRGRVRGLACLGRFGVRPVPLARPAPDACASRRRDAVDAASIDSISPPRPRATSPRPDPSDLVPSLIARGA